MRKVEFGLVVLRSDLKDNVSAVPLSLVSDKVNAAAQDMPYDLVPRHEFSDLLGAEVKIFVVELKLSTELVGTTVNFLRPPFANMMDGFENFFRSLI